MPKGKYVRIKPIWNKGTKGVMKAWNKGKKLTKEHKKALSEAKIKNPVRYWLGKKRDKKTLDKISKSKCVSKKIVRGDKHWNWKGGKTRRCQHQNDYKYKKWRSAVFERDNWTCQTCGERGCVIQAHHIKGWTKFPELRYIINNGVTLCIECHRMTFKHNHQ